MNLNTISEFSKIITLILLGIVLNSYNAKANDADSLLNVLISIKIKNERPSEALNKISEQTGYYFTYNAELLKSTKKFKRQYNRTPLKDVIYDIFKDSTLQYKIIDRQFIIFKPFIHKKIESVSIDSVISEQSKVISIKGKVTDYYSEEPLPFANVSVYGTTFGTITNFDGNFIFNIPDSLIDKDISIKYIGYKPLISPIRHLKFEGFNYRLLKDLVSLQEVVVRIEDPQIIMRKTLENIKTNYHQTPVRCESFYREGITKNRKFMIYSEAVVDVYKPSYKSKSRAQIKVLKGRKMFDTNNIDTILVKLKGGAKTSLRLDMIKNRPDFLTEGSLHKYKYDIVDMVSVNNELAYVMEFKPDRDYNDPIYEGKLYINSKDLAILKIEFKLNKSQLSKNRDMFILKKSRALKAKTVYAGYNISYKKHNGLYYLSNARGELIIKARQKRALRWKKFRTFLEIAINRIDTENVTKIRRKERLKDNTVFSSQHFAYDPEFWGTENFIIPEETIQEAMQRVNKSIERTP